MNISSLALNLLDRSDNIEIVLDLIAYKLHEKYNLGNILVTSFKHEYLAVSLEYEWKNMYHLTEKKSIVHITNEQAAKLTHDASLSIIETLDKANQLVPMLDKAYCPTDGFAIPMIDNERYSGSIIFTGLSEEILENEEIMKDIREVGMVKT